jgi:phage tail sheath protein FI
MPALLTYPGVYVEEISSGVRTITGVATSITAFIGRALRGPCDEPITINNYGDFERIFGGLWVESSLGYAVRNFYINGGSQAVIVRLYQAETGTNAKSSKFKITVGNVKLEAAYKGKWGANIRATVDVDVSEDVAKKMGLTKADLFNLTIWDESTGLKERYLNVSYKPSARRIDKVLEAESKLVRWDSDVKLDISDASKLPAILPDPAAVATAEKALADAKKALTTAENVKPPVQVDIDAAKTALNNAQKQLAIAKKPITDVVTAAEQELADAKKANPQVIDDITTAQGKFDGAKKAASDAVSDGEALTVDNFTPIGAKDNKKGIYALEQLFARDGLFNLLCIPPYRVDNNVDVPLISEAASYCESRRAMLIVDPPSDWKDKATARDKFTDPNTDNVGTRSKNSAIFFPRLRQPNPLRDNQMEEFAPCGAVAGIIARTDTQRGVWKAPAGIDATLTGVPELSVKMTDAENGELNPLGINCLRSFPAAGRVVWGARTLRGNDQLADEWKYVPVRRTALFIEESLYRGTQWVVFEPNDEPLWAQIRLNVGSFMHNLFRQGAFQGKTPKEAYFVKCDKESNPQNDIDRGIVNIMVGFAPLKPAEFVVIKLQQIAGNLEV